MVSKGRKEGVSAKASLDQEGEHPWKSNRRPPQLPSSFPGSQALATRKVGKGSVWLSQWEGLSLQGEMGAMVVGEATVSVYLGSTSLIPWLLPRNVKPRGDPGAGARVPDASSRALP